MTATEHPDTSSYRQPLIPGPQQSHPQPSQYVVVLPPYLPPYYRSRRIRNSYWWRPICFASIFLFVAAAAYILWPSDPEISIVRLHLDRLHFHTRPQISLDITLDLTVKVRNADLFSVDYDSLLVAIGYRGERLGYMTSDGGHIGARGSSYVNATLQLDAVEVLSDVIFLLEDLAKGHIQFETVSEMRGKLGVFFFGLPIKTKISCEVTVNTRNQTITHQSCYPEV